MDLSEAKGFFEQTDRLYERYGKPLEAEHWGKYAAIPPDGRTILRGQLSCPGRPGLCRIGQRGAYL